MKKLISTFVLALALGLVGATLIQSTLPAFAAGQYATHVVSHSPITEPYVAANGANPGAVLGGPDGVAENFDNDGSQAGYVTVGFGSGTTIVDKSGTDVRIHLFDFTNENANGPESEPFKVEASFDGTNFVTLDPTSLVSNQSHINQRSSHDFDLAGKLSHARFIRITNLHVLTGTGQGQEGPDIDAIEALNTGNLPQCSDFIDNDGDGKIDYPADSGCENPTDDDESDKPECSDGKDNDGDGKVDAGDPGCHTDGDPNDGDDSYNPNDNSEKDDQKPQCSDGKDNDGDGLVDEDDPGCHDDQDLSKGYNPEDDNEDNGQCSDKKDNDNDGLTDKKDPDCHTDNDANDGDDTFDGSRDENKNNKKAVKAAVVEIKKQTPAVPVAVTAQTGAGTMVGLAMAILGGSGLALTRRFIKK